MSAVRAGALVLRVEHGKAVRIGDVITVRVKLRRGYGSVHLEIVAPGHKVERQREPVGDE